MPPITSRTLLRALTRPTQLDTRAGRLQSSLAISAQSRSRTAGMPARERAAPPAHGGARTDAESDDGLG